MIGIMGGMVAAGWLGLAAGSTCAATFTQNLGIWQDGPPSPEAAPEAAAEPPSRDVSAPLLVADPVAALPPVSAPVSPVIPPLVAKPKTPARPLAPARASVLAPAQAAPTGAEIVGKSLSQGPSDPDVPLPHPNLAEMSAESAATSRTRLFGRADPGDGVLDFKGGLFGLTVPIPADRNAPGGNTRYSPGVPTLEMGPGTR
ncbi:MAG: hypothetical protein EXR12_09345 [Rhodospirillaceae bacterium]|nr:hypothetical protein [Rhodospirillaceae bacterium]